MIAGLFILVIILSKETKIVMMNGRSSANGWIIIYQITFVYSNHQGKEEF